MDSILESEQDAFSKPNTARDRPQRLQASPGISGMSGLEQPRHVAFQNMALIEPAKAERYRSIEHFYKDVKHRIEPVIKRRNETRLSYSHAPATPLQTVPGKDNQKAEAKSNFSRHTRANQPAMK